MSDDSNDDENIAFLLGSDIVSDLVDSMVPNGPASRTRRRANKSGDFGGALNRLQTTLHHHLDTVKEFLTSFSYDSNSFGSYFSRYRGVWLLVQTSSIRETKRYFIGENTDRRRCKCSVKMALCGTKICTRGTCRNTQTVLRYNRIGMID